MENEQLSTLEYHPELKAAVERCRAVRDLRDRTRKARQRAEQDLPLALRAVEAAKDALAAEETGHVLNGGPKPTGAANRRLGAARDRVDSIQGLIQGLDRALVASEPELEAAQADLQREAQVYHRAVVEASRARLLPLAEAFVGAVRHEIAIGRALGIPFTGLEALEIPDLRLGERPIANAVPQVFRDGKWVRELPPAPAGVSELPLLAGDMRLEVEHLRQRRDAEQRKADEKALRDQYVTAPVIEVDYRPREIYTDGVRQAEE